MKIVLIIFFSLGVLLILFGISISTPFLSWAGKRFNSSNSSSRNYKQPSDIRLTSLLMGISFFMFGLFITIASAALMNFENTLDNSNSSSTELTAPSAVIPTPETFPTPMVPGKNPPPVIKYDNNSLVYNYGLDCPQNVDGLNMRKQAGLNTEIITLIPCNATGIKDKKQRYDRDGIEWYLIEYQENIGWVAGKYLKQQATKPNKTTKYFQLFAKKKTLT